VRILVWLVTNTVAIAVTAWMLPGISFDGVDQPLGEEVQSKFWTVLLVGAIFGVVSSIVEPVVTLLSLPLIVLTLGLFLLVINAAMLMLTGWIAEQLELGFRVDGFWTAVLGGVVMTIVSWGVRALLPDPEVAPRAR
jgi:putative membrane protein